ncbi:hypothetical protein [Herbiconiux ginsengi]|uniref:hypothetical protein n=1 Tax=Herbiconiux ginsengi TaxID=381665 RepID=UPI001114FB39|nr:hypothetical protein [Herbiconiux ginsengi]
MLLVDAAIRDIIFYCHDRIAAIGILCSKPAILPEVPIELGVSVYDRLSTGKREVILGGSAKAYIHSRP